MSLLRTALVVLGLSSVPQWVAASLSTTEINRVVSPGVVQLKCAEPGAPTTRQSLGGLLLTPATATRDLVLVAAHGLSGELTGCRVLWRQQILPVLKVTQGQGDKVSGDWAVLTLNGRFRGQPHRFSWRSVAPDDFRGFTEANGKVYVLKHPNGVAGEGCATHIPMRGLKDATDEDTVLVADCLTIPGMSGAPVMVKMDNRPVLVGLSVGQRFDLSHQKLEWKRRANVIRLIDARVERAIVLAMGQLLQDP